MTRLAVAFVLLAVMVGPALAHAPIKGIGTFYNDVLHPVVLGRRTSCWSSGSPWPGRRLGDDRLHPCRSLSA